MSKPLAAFSLPRGMRNNNPGNIDQGKVKWQGEVVPSNDSRFCQFASLSYGVRALAKLLLTYQAKHKLNTVTKIIGRWAPPIENKTGAYAARVAAALHVGVNEKIDARNPATLRGLVAAIVQHENGPLPKGWPRAQWLSESELNDGVSAALGTLELARQHAR